MSDSIQDRVSRAFEAGHRDPADNLLDDSPHAPGRIRPAAVLVAVTDRPQPGVILTYRPRTMQVHAGQVAFPGGKIEKGETAIQAALREAHEELSITPGEVQIIGESDHFVSRTGFDVAPVLGVVPADLRIIPHPEEVDGWFEAPLAYLLDEANHQRKEVNIKGVQRSYLEILWNGHRIWGVTAAIIHNLSRRLNWIRYSSG